MSACQGGEGRRLASAACGNLPYRWILARSAVAVPPLSYCSELALGERSLRVTAAKMSVAHTFELVRQAEVETVVYLGNIHPFLRRRVNCSPNPKPPPYLHLWGGVWIVLLHLVHPMSLGLGCGGVPCRLCCPFQAACCWGWGERVFWRSQPPWEGYHLRPKIPCCNSPSEVFGFWPS